MRVLVVEDEKKTASFIRKALQSEGDFYCLPPDCAIAGGVVLQSVIQTS